MLEISYDRYKDRRAIRFDLGSLTALFLPDDGAKLASLRDSSGREFMVQAPGDQYRVLTHDGRYGSAECAGFDDMFPTVDAYVSPDGEEYPDHGDARREPHPACLELLPALQAKRGLPILSALPKPNIEIVIRRVLPLPRYVCVSSPD